MSNFTLLKNSPAYLACLIPVSLSGAYILPLTLGTGSVLKFVSPCLIK